MGVVLSFPKMPAGQEPWLTRRDLEIRIGYGRSMIQEFVRRGMPCRKMRGKNLYKASECLAWLELHHRKESA